MANTYEDIIKQGGTPEQARLAELAKIKEAEAAANAKAAEQNKIASQQAQASAVQNEGITYKVVNGNVMGYDARGAVVYDTSGFASQAQRQAAIDALSKGNAPGTSSFTEAERQYEVKTVTGYEKAVDAGSSATYAQYVKANPPAIAAAAAPVLPKTIQRQIAPKPAILAGQSSAIDLNEITSSQELADQLYVAQATGLPLATVQARWGELSSKLGRYSYSNLTKEGISSAEAQAEETGTGKAFIPGIGDITFTKSQPSSYGNASSIPADFGSYMSEEQIIKAKEEAGYRFVTGISTPQGKELLFEKENVTTQVTALPEPKLSFSEQAFARGSKLASGLQAGINKLPIISNVLELSDVATNYFQTEQGKVGGALALFYDVPIGLSKLPRAVIETPKFAVDVAGAAGQGFAYATEGQTPISLLGSVAKAPQLGADYTKNSKLNSYLYGKTVEVLAVTTDPSQLIQLGTQAVAFKAGGEVGAVNVAEGSKIGLGEGTAYRGVEVAGQPIIGLKTEGGATSVSVGTPRFETAPIIYEEVGKGVNLADVASKAENKMLAQSYKDYATKTGQPEIYERYQLTSAATKMAYGIELPFEKGVSEMTQLEAIKAQPKPAQAAIMDYLSANKAKIEMMYGSFNADLRGALPRNVGDIDLQLKQATLLTKETTAAEFGQGMVDAINKAGGKAKMVENVLNLEVEGSYVKAFDIHDLGSPETAKLIGSGKGIGFGLPPKNPVLYEGYPFMASGEQTARVGSSISFLRYGEEVSPIELGAKPERPVYLGPSADNVKRTGDFIALVKKSAEVGGKGEYVNFEQRFAKYLNPREIEYFQENPEVAAKIKLYQKGSSSAASGTELRSPPIASVGIKSARSYPSASISSKASQKISVSISPSRSSSISAKVSPSTSPSRSISLSPSRSPSTSLSTSPSPKTSPSLSPSRSPSTSPSRSPSLSPSRSPSLSPSRSPSRSPSPSPSPSEGRYSPPTYRIRIPVISGNNKRPAPRRVSRLTLKRSRREGRTVLSDLLSLARSQIRFGKATSPSVIRRPYVYGESLRGGLVPTVEQINAGRGRRRKGLNLLGL